MLASTESLRSLTIRLRESHPQATVCSSIEGMQRGVEGMQRSLPQPILGSMGRTSVAFSLPASLKKLPLQRCCAQSPFFIFQGSAHSAVRWHANQIIYDESIIYLLLSGERAGP